MRRLVIGFIVLCALAVARPGLAQRTTPARDTTAAQQPDTTKKILAPGKAFVRSLLVPGWGQFSVGAPRRAVVFITLQSASWYMLVKTLNKFSEARKRQDKYVADARAQLTDTLHAKMLLDTALNRRLTNPDTFKFVLNSAVDTVSLVVGARALVNSRAEQRQDWITYTLFLTLASGVDAFVAAHLADFPAAITPSRQSNGAYQLKVTVPVHRGP